MSLPLTSRGLALGNFLARIAISITDNIPVSGCQCVVDDLKMVYTRTLHISSISLPATDKEACIQNSKFRTVGQFVKLTMVPLGIVKSEDVSLLIRSVILEDSTFLNGCVSILHRPLCDVLVNDNAFIDFVAHVSRSMSRRNEDTIVTYSGQGADLVYMAKKGEVTAMIIRHGTTRQIDASICMGVRELLSGLLVESQLLSTETLDRCLCAVISRRPPASSFCQTQRSVSLCNASSSKSIIY